MLNCLFVNGFVTDLNDMKRPCGSLPIRDWKPLLDAVCTLSQEGNVNWCPWRAYWPSNHQSSSPTSQQPCWICETGRWCGTPLNAWISKSCAAPMTWNWRRRLTECWLSKTVELSTTATRGRLLPTIGPGWCPVKAGSCLDAVDRIRADED